MSKQNISDKISLKIVFLLLLISEILSSSDTTEFLFLFLKIIILHSVTTHINKPIYTIILPTNIPFANKSKILTSKNNYANTTPTSIAIQSMAPAVIISVFSLLPVTVASPPKSPIKVVATNSLSVFK